MNSSKQHLNNFNFLEFKFEKNKSMKICSFWRYFMGRDRWVEYNPKPADKAFGFFHFDASQIPPDWHRWIHHMTDDAPSLKPLPKQKFYMEHQPNYSGLNKSYTPFTTTPTKIHAWDPSKPKTIE